MKKIITEEMRYRQHLCDYALKHGVTKAARRYHTYRQFVYRQLKKYDGTVQSMALRSRKPHRSPNAHTPDELSLIFKMLRRNGRYGFAEVFVRCCSKGYSRCFESMCRQIRKQGYRISHTQRKSYARYEKLQGQYPGEKVQIDIKYVPDECIGFPTYGCRYYQITGIDEYSRKRVLKIVREKRTYETAKYLKELEARMGFRIKTIQVDNGKEFVHDDEITGRNTSFEEAAKALGMTLKRTRPYSPWQNGKVERSHREDGKILYGRYFFSEKMLLQAVEKHERHYNRTAKRQLNFKTLIV